MDATLMELEARKEKMEKEYHDAMARYREELVALEHAIIQRSKEVSRGADGADMPMEGWNAEHEGVVRNDRSEGRHLFEREKVYDGDR